MGLPLLEVWSADRSRMTLKIEKHGFQIKGGSSYEFTRCQE
jgi:hypothetical protein